MDYKSSSTWVYKCIYHLIFTTKYRRKALTSEIQVRCKEIIESLQSDDFLVIELEVMPEHVHLLFSTNPQVDLNASSIAVDAVEVFATVGSVNLDTVKQYIESQKRA